MKTRDIKKLLILLRKNVRRGVGRGYCQSWGLCSLTAMLNSEGIITDKEDSIIGKYLNNNRPHDKGEMDYWWPRGAKQPRLDWLNEQIEKL